MSEAPTSSARPIRVLPRLLLVEDDAPLRMALSRVLRSRFEVTDLGDGAEAAAQLVADRFDVVLADVQLRGMSGIDLLRVVRSYDLDVPVILMTGLPDVDGAIEAMDLGALTYIKKPFEPAVLDVALERATKLAALARAKREVIDAGIGGSGASSERAALTASFDRALASLWVAFQPIVDARTQATVGYEALMRTRETTMPTPGHLLEAAERLARIHDLGRCVRARVAATYERIARETGNDGLLLFVNLHPADLFDDQLFDRAAPLSRISANVVLEITERSPIGDVGDARGRAADLRLRGFRLAIDDLGAGYAGLTSFATFEPEIVKLDMSLVRGIGSSTMKRLIVGRIAGLCRDLAMKVVAEGVETEDELACMIELGCEYVQGYLLGRPSAEPAPSVHRW